MAITRIETALFFLAFCIMAAKAQFCPDDNHPHAIDLGLPSGTKWSCCNVGASSPSEYGNYYAWGETKPKNEYTWETYSLCLDSSHNIAEVGPISGSSYDVAHTNWGNGWHIPLYEQAWELYQMCSVAYEKINGVSGITLTGKNTNRIFLPHAGRYEGREVLYSSAGDSNSTGYYYSDNYDEYERTSASLFVADFYPWFSWASGYIGYSVRPILNGTPENTKTYKDIIKEHGFKPCVAPLLTTQWCQEGAENSKYPDYYSTRPAAGCGPIALAQVLKYWSFPSHGFGNNYYEYGGAEGTNVLYGDFENTYFDWEHMIPRYNSNKEATQLEIDAVGNLLVNIAVALELKMSSSATQIEYIHTALKKFFGYNPNMRLLRQCNGAYTIDEWLTMIYEELSNGRPVLIGGTNAGANHIFVADGYDEEGKVHLNLGHANRRDEDDYYDLAVMYQTYTQNMRMIIGICPQELPAPITSVNVAEAGTLREALGGKRNAQRVTRLKISGNINARDISFLDTLTWTTTGQLSYIDMSDCTIEKNKLPERAFYGSSSEANYTLQEIILPNNLEEIGSNAFAYCRGLYKVVLPPTLKKIGSYAFCGCRYLSEITIPKSVFIMDNNPFLYDKMDNIVIADGNTYFALENGALTNADGSELISLALKPHGDYHVSPSVKSIGGSAFSDGLRMTSISFPTSVKTISKNAIRGKNSLKDIYCYSTNPMQAPSATDAKTCVIHVPHGCKDKYAQYGWDQFSAIVEDIDIDASVQTLYGTTGTTAEYYKINGVKTSNPTSGIYIQNGKKIMVSPKNHHK